MRFSVSTPEFTKAVPEYVTVSLTDYGVIELIGPQSEQFLQGQLSCDLHELSADNWLYASHCDNKGKALATLFVVRWGDRFLLITSNDALQASISQLQKFAVFSQTTIRDASADFPLYGIFGSAAPARVAELLGQSLRIDVAQPVTASAQQLVLQIGDQPEQYLLVSQTALATNSDQWLWHLLEIDRGRATLQSATIQQFVPQMLNVQALHGISFKKGCYIGQETIARMKYLGKQKRALFHLRGQGQPTQAAAVVEQQLGAHWRTAGTVINAVSRAEHQLDLLAVLPSDLSADTPLRIQGDDTSLLEIYPLPYNLDES
jgi:folate-binding protein YgfZ